MSAKLLVVDDDARIRELLRVLLESWGYLVVEAGDGEYALEVFSRESPDLMITDVNMPGMDGYILCRKVRAQSGVPIIVMTAFAYSGEDKAEAFRIGVDAFLVKPFAMAEFRTLVEGLLAKTKTTNGS